MPSNQILTGARPRASAGSPSLRGRDPDGPWSFLALRAAILLGLGLAVSLFPSLAATAQASEAAGFDVQRFRAPLDEEGLLDLEWGALPKEGHWEGLAMLHYANDPLVLYREEGGSLTRVEALVSHRIDLDLGGSVTLLSWLELGLGTRLTVFQTRPTHPAGVEPSLKQLPPLGLGDLRLSPKFSILRAEKAGVDLAFVLGATLPTSRGRSYFGERTATLTPELAISKQVSALRIGANLGYFLRGRYETLGLVVDDELHYRVGLGYSLNKQLKALKDQDVELQLAFSGATAAAAPFSESSSSPLEMLFGANWKLPKQPLALNAGFGVGLGHGYGSPDFRLFVGIRFLQNFETPNPDPDGDGVLSAKDRCPAIAGPIENRGCPDTDHDGDGLVDRLDACPKEAGSKADKGCPSKDRDHDGLLDEADACPDAAGPAEAKGCPDSDSDSDGLVDRLDACPEEAGIKENKGCPDLDTDGDGLADRSDACPTKAEDHDGFEDEDGCPDLDNDADGVVDERDLCPLKAGPTENKGCPDSDRDADGIVDRLDNCPDEAGEVANQGCKVKQLVVLSVSKLEILEKVYFRSGRDVIQPRSFDLLNNVASVLKAHPELQKIRIEGHTDSQGRDEANKRLSQRRAGAVLGYLVKRGLEASRLAAVGYGEERPVESNETREGRASNRRVEFVIASKPDSQDPPQE